MNDLGPIFQFIPVTISEKFKHDINNDIYQRDYNLKKDLDDTIVTIYTLIENGYNEIYEHLDNLSFEILINCQMQNINSNILKLKSTEKNNFIPST